MCVAIASILWCLIRTFYVRCFFMHLQSQWILLAMKSVQMVASCLGEFALWCVDTASTISLLLNSSFAFLPSNHFRTTGVVSCQKRLSSIDMFCMCRSYQTVSLIFNLTEKKTTHVWSFEMEKSFSNKLCIVCSVQNCTRCSAIVVAKFKLNFIDFVCLFLHRIVRSKPTKSLVRL